MLGSYKRSEYWCAQLFCMLLKSTLKEINYYPGF